MPYTSRLTIIVTKAAQAAANIWMKTNIDRQGGEFTFTSPLTSNGSSVTHYWASGQFNEEQLVDMQDKFGANAYTGTPDEALAAAGLQRYSQPL